MWIVAKYGFRAASNGSRPNEGSASDRGERDERPSNAKNGTVDELTGTFCFERLEEGCVSVEAEEVACFVELSASTDCADVDKNVVDDLYEITEVGARRTKRKHR